MEFEEVSPYKRFVREIMRRTRSPLSDLTFLFYLFFGILIFGGLGVWIEVGKNIFSAQGWSWQGILAALAAFYPALIGAACLQLILESSRKSEVPMTAFSVGVLLLTIIAGILLSLFQFNNMFPNLAFWGTLGLSAIGVWIWCVANCDNPDLKTDPTAASGGDTDRPLKGNISGFKAD